MLQQAKFGKTDDSICVSNSQLRVVTSSFSSLSTALNCLLVIAVIIISLAFNRPAHAQTSLDPQKMAAVMSVINMYLLVDREPPIDEPIGEGVVLGLPTLSADTYNATESNLVYAEFELQDEGVELCFDLTAISGDFIVEVNGELVEASEGADNCYIIPEPQQRLINYVTITAIGSGANITIDRFELARSYQESSNGLQRVTRGGWDERAVRKVLKIFAFGGHATDMQIQTWADMDALAAIQEMLNFDEHNLKLSPLAQEESYTETESSYGTLTEFLEFISDTSSYIPIPLDNREQYGLDGYNFDDGFARMITVRGMNPFRQRIGFWETNYHLAVNRDANVSRRQMALYFDVIMQAHEAGLPYKDVMGVAAKSAAAAMQYGHRKNRWLRDTGECDCNDDFAREIHQLYYGIFGDSDPDHENVTIPETAKLLTGMYLPYIDDGYALTVDFQNGIAPNDPVGAPYLAHFPGSVDVLEQNISGINASVKIDNLMPISMQHPESLHNLPVMIISVLADDNLNESRKQQIRDAWAVMGVNRNLLDFLRQYAISTLLHGAPHFKYLTSHERAFYLANKSNLDNLEAYYGGSYYSYLPNNYERTGRDIDDIIEDDFAGEIFRPSHNVFGGQTSIEASDSSLVFENNYNRLTDNEHELRDEVICNSCDQGQAWEKKWQTVLPKRIDGNFYVSDVAEWLWNHAVGNLDDFTELERAHLYSLLGAARDFPGDGDDGRHAFDFNLVMCVMADYEFDDQGFMNGTASITDILAGNGKWNDYCEGEIVGETIVYDQHELAELNAQYSGTDIANNPQIQSILTELGNETIPLDAIGAQHANNGADLRKNARERVSSALGFIFTTPFVFAEGQ